MSEITGTESPGETGQRPGWLVEVRDWVDARLPIMDAWKKHLSEYYAPKNFNFWYYFGVLSMLVLVGLCPHLFCSPTPHVELRPQPFDTDWRGGFFCPCHGSRFDLAGRVYSGSPASRNMQVPPYSFESENILVVGVDEETSA